MSYNMMARLFLLFIISIVGISGCSDEPSVYNRFSMGKNVICYGDDITAGYGVELSEAYPYLLGQKTGEPVINAGKVGITTQEALARLKEEVLDKNPRLVILELGTNDYTKNINKEETFENIDQIVLRVQNAGAMVAIVTTRVGIIQDTYLDGYREIAKKRRAVLIPNIMQDIADNLELSFETIHPNTKGQRIIAERIYQAIKHII